MPSSLTDILGAFFMFALLAFSVQNAVFARSLAISRLISLVDDTTDTALFGALLTVVTVANSAGCYLIQRYLLDGFKYAEYVRPLAFVLCAAVIFFIVVLLSMAFTPTNALRKIVRVLPLASFNILVIGTALLCFTRELSLIESLGFALGSSVGFIVAVLLVTEVQRKLQNRSIPAAFKGLPATLLFLSALALAVYGFTGFSLTF